MELQRAGDAAVIVVALVGPLPLPQEFLEAARQDRLLVPEPAVKPAAGATKATAAPAPEPAKPSVLEGRK